MHQNRECSGMALEARLRRFSGSMYPYPKRKFSRALRAFHKLSTDVFLGEFEVIHILSTAVDSNMLLQSRVSTYCHVVGVGIGEPGQGELRVYPRTS